jgi:hypothetical protein
MTPFLFTHTNHIYSVGIIREPQPEEGRIVVYSTVRLCPRCDAPAAEIAAFDTPCGPVALCEHCYALAALNVEANHCRAPSASVVAARERAILAAGGRLDAVRSACPALYAAVA